MKNVKEIEFKVEGKKWDDLLDKAFKKKSKDTQVDGFRKGNCPKEVFIKKFGIESLYMEASEMALDEAYKFRMYPDNNPIILINKTFGCVRFVYNYFLNKCKFNKQCIVHRKLYNS